MNRGRARNGRSSSSSRGGGWGRSPFSGSGVAPRYRPAGDGVPSSADSYGSNDGISQSDRGMYMPQTPLSNHSERKPAFRGYKRGGSSNMRGTYVYVRKDEQRHNSANVQTTTIQSNCSTRLSPAHGKDLSEDLHLDVGMIQIGQNPSDIAGDTQFLSCKEGSAPESMEDVSEPGSLEQSENSEVIKPSEHKPSFPLYQSSRSSNIRGTCAYARKDQQEHNSGNVQGSTMQSNFSNISNPAQEMNLSKDLHLDVGMIQIGQNPSDIAGDTQFLSCKEGSAPESMEDVSEPGSLEQSENSEVIKPSEHKPSFPLYQSSRSSNIRGTYVYVRKDEQRHNSANVQTTTIQSNCSTRLSPAHGKDLSEDLHLDVGMIQIGQNPSDIAGDTETLSCKEELAPIESMEKKSGPTSLEQSENSGVLIPFDICPPPKVGTGVVLKPSLLVKNRERRNETKYAEECINGKVLKPGMIHLKRYISLTDQIKLVKKCRDLGLGSGGFYQPGYRDGAKLHLKMMCLGKNWDPETSRYGDYRPIDGATPPGIPKEFYNLVEMAIKESHTLIRKETEAYNVEDILPRMVPDICLANFYYENGRLGLHQDRDESSESLRKELPVVSFSIGDSADFLFGNQRDVEKADNVVLESGDVLIFGGKSRHVFHGVAKIHPNTAPKALLEQTNLLAGRLNLTFRQY